MNDNMKLWDSVCKTDPKTTKQFKGKGGFVGTAVCAQSQRKAATEQFGPYGIDWGVCNEKFEILARSDDPHDSMLVYTGNLQYPWGDKKGALGLVSSIDLWQYVKSYKTWIAISDIHKKVRTDALTKGLSELGFNSDVFEGKFDDSKYVTAMQEEFAPPPPTKEPTDNQKADAKKIGNALADQLPKPFADMDGKQQVDAMAPKLTELLSASEKMTLEDARAHLKALIGRKKIDNKISLLDIAEQVKLRAELAAAFGLTEDGELLPNAS